tara:strand:+ start:394 stop:531 length:138 start_codon:yes stop_codon:yes gene_type:complete
MIWYRKKIVLFISKLNYNKEKNNINHTKVKMDIIDADYEDIDESN